MGDNYDTLTGSNKFIKSEMAELQVFSPITENQAFHINSHNYITSSEDTLKIIMNNQLKEFTHYVGFHFHNGFNFFFTQKVSIDKFPKEIFGYKTKITHIDYLDISHNPFFISKIYYDTLKCNLNVSYHPLGSFHFNVKTLDELDSIKDKFRLDLKEEKLFINISNVTKIDSLLFFHSSNKEGLYLASGIWDQAL